MDSLFIHLQQVPLNLEKLKEGQIQNLAVHIKAAKRGKREETGGKKGEKQVGSRGFCHCDG